MLNGCAYILTVDVGNTFIRFGLFAEDSAAAQECPLATCEITTPSSITADEARMRLVQVMAALAADAGMPGALVPAAAVLSCVVPALERPWKAALSRTCTGRVLTVGPGLRTVWKRPSWPRSAPTASPMLWRHAPSTARRAL